MSNLRGRVVSSAARVVCEAWTAVSISKEGEAVDSRFSGPKNGA